MTKSTFNGTDNETLRNMTNEEFSNFIEDGILFINHHEVLCTVQNADVIACTQEHIDCLINYLTSIKSKLPKRATLI